MKVDCFQFDVWSNFKEVNRIKNYSKKSVYYFTISKWTLFERILLVLFDEAKFELVESISKNKNSCDRICS